MAASALRCRKKTKDQLGGYIELFPAGRQGTGNPGEYGCKGNPPLGVGLRVEKDLGMTHILGRGLFQIGPGQIIKILFLVQNIGPFVINIQE